MADARVSDLLPANALTGTELFYADDGINDVKVTANQFRSFAQTLGAGISTQAGTSYTLRSSDNGTIISFSNASAIAVTLPNNMPIGFDCVLEQEGAGQITISPGTGATMQSAFTANKTTTQYATAYVFVLANGSGTTADWRLSGDLTA